MTELYTHTAANVNSLHSRRHDISKSFFQDNCDPSSCIHHLLPPPPYSSVLFRLRTVTPRPRLSSRTKKHCSFIIHALNNYQKSTQLTTNLTIPYIVIFFFALYFVVLICFSSTVLYLSIRLLLVASVK